MKELLTTCLLSLLMSSVAIADGLPYYIHAYGYGPAKIGMLSEEASRVLEVPLASAESGSGGCYYVYPDGDNSSMGYMVQNNRIARIDVWSDAVKTLSGLSVGSKEEEIQAKFKSKVLVEEHEYLGAAGHYVTVNVYGGNQLVFETRAEKVVETPEGCLKAEDFRVTRFRIGKPSAVSLIEGCL